MFTWIACTLNKDAKAINLVIFEWSADTSLEGLGAKNGQVTYLRKGWLWMKVSKKQEEGNQREMAMKKSKAGWERKVWDAYEK